MRTCGEAISGSVWCDSEKFCKIVRRGHGGVAADRQVDREGHDSATALRTLPPAASAEAAQVIEHVRAAGMDRGYALVIGDPAPQDDAPTEWHRIHGVVHKVMEHVHEPRV